MRKRKQEKCFIILLLLVLFSTIWISQVQGMKDYKKSEITNGVVVSKILNLRQGPSASYPVVLQLKENDPVYIIGEIGNWYVVKTEKDYIGAVSKNYIKEKIVETDLEETIPTTVLTEDEEEVLVYLNQEREKKGIEKLEINEEIQNVARKKAKDMVENGYFSHESPTYGSLSQMLEKEKIFYLQMAENIVGANSNLEAVAEWNNSEEHKINMVNAEFTKTGIGVVGGSPYGKIYVQIFIKE